MSEPAASAVVLSDPVPGSRIAGWEIVRLLGRGGMAVVYRALEPVMRRPTALKVVRKSELDPAQAGGAAARPLPDGPWKNW